jgi:tRNA threonylcarbamoyladenosine biosynthesis protein TsaE
MGIRDDLRPDALLFIEWPERAEGFLPSPNLHVRLTHEGTGCRVELSAETPKSREIMAGLAA